MTVTDPYDSPTNRLMEMDMAAQRAQQPEYQTGPAEQRQDIKITYVEERNGGYLEMSVGGEAMGIPLTLPELEGLYVAIGDVWRMAKVKNKQLGKVKSDLEDLL